MFKRKVLLTHLPCQIGEEFYYMDKFRDTDTFNFCKVTVESITYNADGVSIWAYFNEYPENGTTIKLNKNAFKTKAELIKACGNS